MAYKKMDAEDIYEMYRRALSCENAAQIGRALNVDAKTVRSYLAKLSTEGLNLTTPNLNRNEGLLICQRVLPANIKPQPAQSELIVHAEYIRELLTDKHEPLKTKTAYLAVREKFQLNTSYSSFKRFVRDNELLSSELKAPLRIEREAGKEVQLDYGKVGRLYDPVSKRNRDVYAFVGILAFSRHMYVEYGYRQDQVSFCKSIIHMLEFFGGVMRYIVIDNLKAGVIKPDLYLPRINRALAEVAEYYKFFVSPGRVRRPTDKGKVERQIPVAREMFRRFKCILEKPTLDSINKKVKDCILKEYGKRIHGTTGKMPILVYQEEELSTLSRMPEERFNIPLWKIDLTVHRDRFIQVLKKRYCLPQDYCGKLVDARILDNKINVFYKHELVREYIITSKTVHMLPADFPTEREKMLQDQYPSELILRASRLCREAGLYIESILKPHAYLNIRQALGIIDELKKHVNTANLSVICNKARRAGYRAPSQIRALIKYEGLQLNLMEPALSESERSMTRSADYYMN